MQFIGEGAYGRVYKWDVERDDGQVDCFAVKEVMFDSIDSVYRATMLLREIRLMAHFADHDNLLSLRDVMVSPDARSVYLYSTFCNQDLATLLRSGRILFEPSRVMYVMHVLLSALHAMHTAGVIHCDVKPSNILMADNGNAILADFGLSSPSGEGGDKLHYVATRSYRAPEVVLREPYSTGVDIWGLGCVLAEMMAPPTGQRLLFPAPDSLRCPQRGAEHIERLLDFTGNTPGVSGAWIRQTNPSKQFVDSLPACPPCDTARRFPTSCPDSLSLLHAMLTFDPTARPSAAQCLAHTYFGEYAWGDGSEDTPYYPFEDVSLTTTCTTRDEAVAQVCLSIDDYRRSKLESGEEECDSLEGDREEMYCSGSSSQGVDEEEEEASADDDDDRESSVTSSDCSATSECLSTQGDGQSVFITQVSPSEDVFCPRSVASRDTLSPPSE